MSNRRFTKRSQIPGAMYHVTLHSAALTKAFASRTNKSEYLQRIANYLSPREFKDSSRHRYEKLRHKIRVLTFCILDDHIHLLVIDTDGTGVTRLMHRVNTGYSAFFNRRHNRRGPLFDAPFAAKPIVDEDHARAVIAYINLNHVTEQLDYEFSGHKAMVGDAIVDWLDVDAALSLFDGVEGYVRYMNRNGSAIIRRKLEEKGVNPLRHRYRSIKRPLE